jgi:hypothetical protein
MPYTNTFEQSEGYVLGRVEGGIDRPVAEEMSREGLALGRKSKFFETVAKNRGWFNIHYFEDIGSAIKWLEQAGE